MALRLQWPRTLCVSLLSLSFLSAQNTLPEADQKFALEIYKEMVQSKTGYTTGTTTPLVQALAARLRVLLR